MQQRHRAAEHAGDGVVAAGHHCECERQDRQRAGDVTVGAHPRGHQVGDRVVLGGAATTFDQAGEVGHHRPDRIADALQRPRDAAVGGVGRDDRLGPAVELHPVLFGHTEIMRDHHRRQRFEQLGDDVTAAGRAQPLDALDDEFPHLGFHRLDLSRREPARHQLAELGVHRWILHHERWIVLQPNQFQIVIVDGQALRRGEGVVVAGRRPHVGVPRQHVVVMLGRIRRNDVVHGVVVAQSAVHRPRVRPGGGGRELEVDRCVLRHNSSHVLFVRQRQKYVNRPAPPSARSRGRSTSISRPAGRSAARTKCPTRG